MSIVRHAKRRLGALRDEILFGADNRRIAAQAVQMRAGWIDASVRELAPLPTAPTAPDVEVHSMSGEAQAHMGLWSAWSVMRYLPQARYVLHDDGSLSAPTLALWHRLLPGMRVVAPDESAAAMARLFPDAPRVAAWTKSYHFGLKLGAMQAMAEAPRILDIDTDVLVLDRPAALIGMTGDPAWTLAWNRDGAYCYAYPETLLSEVLGDLIGPLPERLNGGLTGMACFTPEEWRALDAILGRMEADPRVDPLRYWMHQTLIACVASRRGDAARPLPDAYDIYPGPTRPGSVARHFVGNARTRPRFFTEGVPTLIRSARVAGHLPADFAADHVPIRL